MKFAEIRDVFCFHCEIARGLESFFCFHSLTNLFVINPTNTLSATLSPQLNHLVKLYCLALESGQ